MAKNKKCQWHTGLFVKVPEFDSSVVAAGNDFGLLVEELGGQHFTAVSGQAVL